MRTKILSLGVCFILTYVVVLIIKGSSYFIDIIEDLRGYDYTPKMSKGYDWIGPKNGEVIDLTSLKDEKGISLSEKSNGRLTLLTVVDPGCAACKETEEQFHFLNEKVKEIGVNYYIVCFSPKVQANDLSAYVKSLHMDTESMIWTNDFQNVLPSIKAIAFPSHILIDSAGDVIKSFPGTSNENRVRNRMVSKVLEDVTIESNQKTNIDE